MPVVELKFSGPPAAPETGDQCLATEVADTGLSESTCGNGNSDLYKALLALIQGNPLPVRSTQNNFSTSVWVQDQVGNGYEATIARGTLTKEEHVTSKPVKLFNISPDKITNGIFDLEKETGLIIDKIWSASWAGYVTDGDGNTTAKPALSISGSQITLTPPTGVFGCMKVKYELTRDRLKVNNDGDGETSGDPYSTAITFDVDGCDEERVLQLPAQQCLAEWLGNPLGINELFESFIDDLLTRDDAGNVVIKDPPPTEQAKDTSRQWRYCDRKFISASPPAAGEGYEDTCYGGKCGNCGDDDAE
jgi:hypothetical protein